MASSKRHKAHTAAAVPAPAPFVDRLLWWILVAGVVVIPCFVQPTGQESFRFPKLLLFRAEGILLLTIVGIAAIWGKFDFRRYDLRKPAVWLPLAIVGWTAITTATSQKPLISLYSLLTVITGFTIYLLTYALARSKSIRVAGLVLIPALVNALVYWLQKAKVWNPLVPDRWTLMASNTQQIQNLSDIALQGNRNDVGTFLLMPSLLAIVLATTSKGRMRLGYGTAALLLIATLIVSQTLSAIIALAAGILALATVRSWKAALAAIAAVLLVALPTFRYYPPLQVRLRNAKIYVSQRSYNQLLSGRLNTFIAAKDMAGDHPLLGVGPGLFAREYFDYKLQVDRRHGANPLHVAGMNFGEVHNDHLQTLDETGFPGFLGLEAAILVIGSISFRRKDPASENDPRFVFLRHAAFPAALSFAVVALAQFPLQIASTLVTYAFIFGLMEGWSESS